MNLRQTTATSYVAAQPPTVEAKPQPTQEHVSAQVHGNMAGGIGATVVVFAGWMMLHGAMHGAGIVTDAWPNMAQVTVGATLTGLLVFGGLMFARNSLDEAMDLKTRMDLERYIADLEAGIGIRDDRIAMLQRELDAANVQTSMRQLQAAGPAQRLVPAQKTLSPAWTDAYNLVILRWGGHSWARDAMRKQGWSDRRHADAMDVLRRCGVAVDGGPKVGMQPWDSAATVDQALAIYNRHRGMTLAQLGSVAGHASDATLESDATANTSWGRGEGSWNPTNTDVR